MSKTPYIEIIRNVDPAKAECFLCHGRISDSVEITLNDGGVFSVGLCSECFDDAFIGSERFEKRLTEFIDNLDQQKRWLNQVRLLASRGELPVR